MHQDIIVYVINNNNILINLWSSQICVGKCGKFGGSNFRFKHFWMQISFTSFPFQYSRLLVHHLFSLLSSFSISGSHPALFQALSLFHLLLPPFSSTLSRSSSCGNYASSFMVVGWFYRCSYIGSVVLISPKVIHFLFIGLLSERLIFFYLFLLGDEYV